MENGIDLNEQVANNDAKVIVSKRRAKRLGNRRPSLVTSTISRYGRKRRPRITRDFYNTERLMTRYKNGTIATDEKSHIQGIIRLDLETVESPTYDCESNFNSVLKIVSKPTFRSNDTSPPSPTFKTTTLKTYSNRKKLKADKSVKDVLSQLDSFSWTEDIEDPCNALDKLKDVSLYQGECRSRKSGISSLDVDIPQGNTVARNILAEFEDLIDCDVRTHVDNVTSTETQEEPVVEDVANVVEELKPEEVQSPIIDSSTQILQLKTEPVNQSKVDNWQIGDILWTRVGKCPYWPSMVDLDPISNTFVKCRIFGKNNKIPYFKLHVRFFGDSGRRSWVIEHTALRFNGREEFDELARVAKNVNDKKKGKSPFEISQAKYAKWLEAVSEAEMLVDYSLEEKLIFFDQAIQLNKAPKKRLFPNESKIDEISSILSDNDSNNVQTSTPKINSSFEASDLSQKDNTTLASPKTRKRGRPMKNKKKLLIKKKLKRLKNKKNIYPKRDRKQVERFIANNDSIKKVQESTNQELIPIEPDTNNIKKRTSIFKGVTKNKVCQICKKPNNIFKCRGICMSYFHFECVKNDDESKKQPPSPSLMTSRKSITLAEAELIDAKMADVMKNVDQNIRDPETSNEDSGNESDGTSVVGTIPDTANEDEELSTSRELKCKDCEINRLPACFVCGQYDHPDSTTERQKCSIFMCGRVYHPICLKVWPQTQWITNTNARGRNKSSSIDTLVCPYHVCHTCVSDDPRGLKARFSSKERLVKCIRCPSSYHVSNYCVPAGSEILTRSQLICPKHLRLDRLLVKAKRRSGHHVNANWCFICAVGGSLICCETCPNSFHAECLKINLPEGSYICEDCETGRLPLYDEIVWVKLGLFRWWPAQILFPDDIPITILSRPHQTGEFVVKFFGSHDYYWINRGRVFLYQDGDMAKVTNNLRKSINELYNKANEEAAIAFKRVQIERQNRALETRPSIRPPPYVKIKTNRPVGNVRVGESGANSLTPCECDPNVDEPCGPDSECLNRLLMTECNPTICPAGTRCCNQQFEKRNYPELVPYKTDHCGWGLKTLEAIKKGQFIIEYVGEMINEDEYKRRIKRMSEQKDENYYFLTIDKEVMLDAGPKGNVARFMNHSCQPNCETQKWTVNGMTRVGLFALQDIEKDTELTFNYNLECIGKEKKVCSCGAPLCSGFIGVKAKQEEPVRKRKHLKNGSTGRSKYKSSRLRYGKCKACFVCGELNSELRCRSNICSKTYHVSCVQLSEWPKGNWWCPRHRCHFCPSKYYLQWCTKCPRSFCPKHIEKNVQFVQKKQIICLQHKNETTSISPVNNVEQLLSTPKQNDSKKKRFNLSLIKSPLNITLDKSVRKKSKVLNSTLKVEDIVEKPSHYENKEKDTISTNEERKDDIDNLLPISNKKLKSTQKADSPNSTVNESIEEIGNINETNKIDELPPSVDLESSISSDTTFYEPPPEEMITNIRKLRSSSQENHSEIENESPRKLRSQKDASSPEVHPMADETPPLAVTPKNKTLNKDDSSSNLLKSSENLSPRKSLRTKYDNEMIVKNNRSQKKPSNDIEKVVMKKEEMITSSPKKLQKSPVNQKSSKQKLETFRKNLNKIIDDIVDSTYENTNGDSIITSKIKIFNAKSPRQSPTIRKKLISKDDIIKTVPNGSNPVHEDLSMINSLLELVEPVVKRKRGRPSKQLLEFKPQLNGINKPKKRAAVQQLNNVIKKRKIRNVLAVENSGEQKQLDCNTGVTVQLNPN